MLVQASDNSADLDPETATGRKQWEPPTFGPAAPIDALASPLGAPSQPSHSKRRQYAAGQTQAYYGAPDPAAVGGYTAGDPAGAPAQLFTPGLAAESQFQQQQAQAQQPPYYQPGQPDYSPYGGQQPTYGAPSSAGQVNQLADQFSQMGVGGQKALRLQTTNLLTSPPDPFDLLKPPPEIILPPNSSLTTSPYSNAPPSYQRSTLNAIPTTNSLLNKSKIPLALIITPYRSLKEGDMEVPLVTDTVIARCRRCRTYINPYVQFIDGGNRWRCCMCSMSNEVPQLFDWDQNRNQPGDRWARAELNYSVVEFIAPTEYMVRPPQPAVYVFLIDVSHAAIQSGMLIYLISFLHAERWQGWLRLRRVLCSKTLTGSRMKILGQKLRLLLTTPRFISSRCLCVTYTSWIRSI